MSSTVDRYAPGHLQRAQARFPNWKPAHHRFICLRMVAGKRCQGGGTPPDCCICLRYIGHLLTHQRAWTDQNGKRVTTSEPYTHDWDNAGQTREAFLMDCADLGLSVEVRPPSESPWDRDGAYLLIIRRTIHLTW